MCRALGAPACEPAMAAAWARSCGACRSKSASATAAARRLKPFLRRAAAVALIQEAKHGRRTDRILEIAELLIGDSDDMVQKGVGWLLKVAYAKKPREIVAFLEKRKATTPRLILRYAAEKMNAADRRAVLDRT